MKFTLILLTDIGTIKAWDAKNNMIKQLLKLSPNDPEYVWKFLQIKDFQTLVAVPEIQVKLNEPLYHQV